MKKVLILIATMFSVFVFTPQLAFADAKSEICRGVNTASGATGSACGSGSGVTGILATVLNLLSFIVGIAAVIMIIIGGLKYITSGGESSNVNSAKNTILYAVIGLVIVALAQVIVRFVLKRVSG
jgi:Type IV secretion system pilin